MRNEKGFTLIELLIVVAIIGIIAAIAIPSLLNALDRARQTTTVANVQELGKSVEQYSMDFPNIGAPKYNNDLEGLQTTIAALEINDNPMVIKDGWGNELIYQTSGTAGDKLYTIMSYGSDNAQGPDPETDGVVKQFNEDIIWVKGTFTQRPEGRQLSGDN